MSIHLYIIIIIHVHTLQYSYGVRTYWILCKLTIQCPVQATLQVAHYKPIPSQLLYILCCSFILGKWRLHFFNTRERSNWQSMVIAAPFTLQGAPGNTNQTTTYLVTTCLLARVHCSRDIQFKIKIQNQHSGRKFHTVLNCNDNL